MGKIRGLKIIQMEIFWVALIFIKCSKVAGIWMSTMLPLPRDLELLIDSMYDDGYSAEYLVKYDDINGDDLAQSDLLLGWERPRSSAENPVMRIIDPDRDGARSLPAWMNYSKAVFVPNEIDYKIRARHRYHPHSGRMGGTLQKQIELYHPDESFDANKEINQGDQVTMSTKSNRTGTSENLDFLLPIPDYGPTSKSQIATINKIKPMTKEFSPQPLKGSIMNSFIIPQLPEMQVISTGPEMSLVTPPPRDRANSAAPSLVALVDRFRKQFKQIRNENFTKNGISTLEQLHTRLLQMRTWNNEYIQSRKSEEEKQLSQMEDSNGFSNNIKKHRAIRPLITHTRMSHPGHRETYIAHVKPLTLHQRNNKGYI